MANDYLLFIHGVYTRSKTRNASYADKLFDRIHCIVQSEVSTLQLIKVPLYWGDVNEAEEKRLRDAYASSPDWSKFWFRSLRETALLQFIGDAALYMSRSVGAKVVSTLEEQIREGLKNVQAGDRVHLVAHSFGAIILFDMLFASRWDPPDEPGHESIMRIRELMYGVDPAPQDGFRLASISTLGAPIGLFSLMNVTLNEKNERISSHDINPRLRRLLQHLQEDRGTIRIPWLNFAHPADPLAYPLKPLLYQIVGEEHRYLDVRDYVNIGTNWLDIVTSPFSQTALALANVGNAHASYWYSQKVAQKIALAIVQSAQVSSVPQVTESSVP